MFQQVSLSGETDHTVLIRMNYPSVIRVLHVFYLHKYGRMTIEISVDLKQDFVEICVMPQKRN